jgi:hypothetical protein
MTAVEIFFEDLVHLGYIDESLVQDRLKLALELEKQQIIDAYQWGRTDQHSKESKWYNRNAKKYYSETYKNKTE